MKFDQTVLCAGTNCPRHSVCQHYVAIEGNRNERQIWIGRCGDDFGGFMPAKAAPVELASAAEAA